MHNKPGRSLLDAVVGYALGSCLFTYLVSGTPLAPGKSFVNLLVGVLFLYRYVGQFSPRPDPATEPRARSGLQRAIDLLLDVWVFAGVGGLFAWLVWMDPQQGYVKGLGEAAASSPVEFWAAVGLGTALGLVVGVLNYRNPHGWRGAPAEPNAAPDPARL